MRTLLLVALLATRVWAAGECAACHPAKGTQAKGQGPAADVAALGQSIHKNASCVDCHPGAEKPGHTSRTAAPSCRGCHSVHLKHGQVAPTCRDCHGYGHGIVGVTSPGSPLHKTKQPATCGRCHSSVGLTEGTTYAFSVVRPVEAFSRSVHGKALFAGDLRSASCCDCHSSHAVLPARDPKSAISKGRVASTCGKCHREVAAQYGESTHGRAVSRGVDSSPSCVDCHGEHAILASSDPGSPVHAGNVSWMTCSRCHEDQRLNARLGLARGRLATYESSFHGLAARAGSKTVANCASCHGVHDILPSTDSRSTVAKANLGKTCGRCHPYMGRSAAVATIHAVPESGSESPWIRCLRLVYMVLIPLSIGIMVLHNALHWLRKLIEHVRTFGRPECRSRLTLHERLQHALLFTSFFVLVVTGFALAYPTAFWARPLLAFEAQYPVRGLVHRLAALVMMAAAVYHVLYLIVSNDGRRCIRDMLPRLGDLKDVALTAAYFVGLRDRPPVYARFSYVEKAEYWSMVWGAAVMIGTGAVLWAHDLVLRYTSTLVTDIATLVHFYEAVLAALAIVLWHFYSVIFDPEVYPVRWTFVNGLAPRHEVREEPAEFPPPGIDDRGPGSNT